MQRNYRDANACRDVNPSNPPNPLSQSSVGPVSDSAKVQILRFAQDDTGSGSLVSTSVS